MKLIIDIPESIFDTIQADEMISREQLAILQIHIQNGIPLDDVKAEINEMTEEYCDLCAGYCGVSKKYVMDILDNIGKDKGGE
jgi:hypothetical protein